LLPNVEKIGYNPLPVFLNNHFPALQHLHLFACICGEKMTIIIQNKHEQYRINRRLTQIRSALDFFDSIHCFVEYLRTSDGTGNRQWRWLGSNYQKDLQGTWY
jgi:hypothetical protein